MLWIGITGTMGSGKSTVSAILRELGFTVVDADEMVRQVLSPGGDGERDVLHVFGDEPGVRSASGGGLDRRALGRVVFADPAKLEQLERLIHPRVQAEVARVRAGLVASGAAAAFYDVPLLFEKKMEPQFDRIVVVSTSPDVRLKRAMARTGLSQAEIEERWNRQLSPEFKEARASVVIVNNGDLSELKAAVRASLPRLGVSLSTSPG